MTYTTSIIMALGAVFLNVFAHLLLKHTSSKASIKNFDLSNLSNYLLDTVFTMTFVFGVGFAFISSLLYLISLNKLPLSVAFPFTGLSFIIIFLLGIILFNEKITIMNSSGLIIMLIGIAMITFSS